MTQNILEDSAEGDYHEILCCRKDSQLRRQISIVVIVF
jgi:hypothetical protein